jgi:PAS domain S-box-containing protein
MSPPEWRFNSGNPAAVALFGAADEADLCSRAPWEYSPPEQPDGRPSAEAALDRIQSAMQHGSSSFNWTHRRRDGTDFSAQVQLVALTLDGQPGLQATVRDVTVEQQLQTELSHARKLEAVGQLAAGIAHEINTPTQFVSDSVHFLNEAFEAVTQLLGRYQTLLDEPIEQQAAQLAAVRALEEELDLPFLLENIPSSFQRCFDGLGRITGIVRAMKEFAHPDEREKSLGDLNHALESTLVIAANEYKYVSRVETDFGDLPMVECHLSDLNQVFLNLIVNAAHAIGDVVQDSGDKGVIRVATRLDGDYARITIADTGSGIKESLRQRVFDPFFTTKPVGKGSGQGLAIARSIVVDKHGGTITVDSEVGQGTTFTIALPVTAAAPAEVAR